MQVNKMTVTTVDKMVVRNRAGWHTRKHEFIPGIVCSNLHSFFFFSFGMGSESNLTALEILPGGHKFWGNVSSWK